MNRIPIPSHLKNILQVDENKSNKSRIIIKKYLFSVNLGRLVKKKG